MSDGKMSSELLTFVADPTEKAALFSITARQSSNRTLPELEPSQGKPNLS